MRAAAAVLLAVVVLVGSIDAQEAEPTQLGEPIFNGRDLSGWWTPGNKESWPVIGGELVCINKNGNYLRTEEEFENFTLSFEYKMAKGGNSGVGIRTPRNGWPSGDGMELQLMDEKPGAPLTRHSTMAIYGNLEPLARADKSEEWNRVVIKADGYMISAWVNGVLVQHANTYFLPELKHRNLKGWIGFQDHGARTQFRNIRVLRAPPGRGPEPWYAPRPRQGSEIVVDRLMNLDTLTKRDGVGAGFLMKQVNDSGATTLADLAGPGAVVEVHRTGDSGRAALYFDGEDKPRVECAAKDLAGKLPRLGEDRQPLLTYVPYRKRLRIVLRDARPCDYRIAYVSFPKDVQVEEFAGPAATMARGLLPALSYRYEQHGWGTVRDYDPLPRASAEKKTIEPGSTLPLVSLEGVGIVEWLRLNCSNKVLEHDDLWLEVTIDGESTPAIAAPARYIFPGMADGKRYRNFVVTSKNGFTNRLAMPFGNGLKVAAVNKSTKPLKDISLAVSYRPATDQDRDEIAGRMRLRGQFATGPGESLFAQSGRGRWIGLICGVGEGEASPSVTALEQDGLPCGAWSASSFDALLGLAADKTDDRRFCCGRLDGLAWRYLLLAPIEFERSLVLKGAARGGRLALSYVEKQ